MGISGNLRTMEFAELLQWLAQGSKTGTLYVRSADVEKKIYFKDGRIISTSSNHPKEFLGHFLVSHGFIDERVLAKAMEMQASNRMLLGKILVTINAISEEDLDRMLRLKAEESIYEIFTWAEGEFRFQADELPEFKMVPLALNVTGVVLEGAQRMDDWKRIQEKISSNQVVPVAVRELQAPEDDPLAARILALVDDDRTIEEIALHTHSSDYQVCRVLFPHIQAGGIKTVRPRVTGPGGGETGGEVGVDTLLRRAELLIEEGSYERSLRHLRAALNLDPDNRRIQTSIRDAERRIRHRIDEAGVTPAAVPVLKRTFEELTQLDITPQQGFILTRINGTYDIETILKISPMPPLDGLLVFWRLLEGEHIELKPGRERPD